LFAYLRVRESRKKGKERRGKRRGGERKLSPFSIDRNI